MGQLRWPAGLPVPVTPGLTERELLGVQRRHGFRFAADHRLLLSRGLPVGGRFPDWRDGDVDQLRALLAAPRDGVLFDVEHAGFWHRSWAARPRGTEAALAVAADALSRVPPLVPVYSHRYLPGLGGPAGHPVLSVRQTDVVVYGADLSRYLRAEFGGGWRPELAGPARSTVPFWSDLLG